MATLLLFDHKIKSVPLTSDGEWQRYFDSNDFEQLAQELGKYKTAGYLNFHKETVKTMLLNKPRYSNEPTFDSKPISFVVTEIHAGKVGNDLAQYLKNWRNDKLLTSTGYKPDDSAHQHDKLLVAFANVYERQDMPRISKADIFRDDTNYEPPFWETVLAPQLLDHQYEIRQMGYDLNNHEQPFVDVKITDLKLHRSIELAAKSSEPINDEEPPELNYHGLSALRDDSFNYRGINIPFTPQEAAVMRVFMTRPEEWRYENNFTDPLANVFAAPEPPDVHKALSQLISRTRIKLNAAVSGDGQNYISNKRGVGWKLIIPPAK